MQKRLISYLTKIPKRYSKRIKIYEVFLSILISGAQTLNLILKFLNLKQSGIILHDDVVTVNIIHFPLYDFITQQLLLSSDISSVCL